MLKEEDYCLYDKVFLFATAFINGNTEYDNRAPMTRVHTLYGDIAANETRDMSQWSCARRIWVARKKRKELKKMLVETFEKHCDPGLYTLIYLLLDRMV